MAPVRPRLVHQSFPPGQFDHLVKAWAQRPEWDVHGLGPDTAPSNPGFDKLTRYKVARRGHSTQYHNWCQTEMVTQHVQAPAQPMLEMRKGGFTTDVDLAPPVWVETLDAKDLFPGARLVRHYAWYHNANGADLGFDPEFPLTFDDLVRIRAWNARRALNLTNCDAAISPMQWRETEQPLHLALGACRANEPNGIELLPRTRRASYGMAGWMMVH